MRPRLPAADQDLRNAQPHGIRGTSSAWENSGCREPRAARVRGKRSCTRVGQSVRCSRFDRARYAAVDGERPRLLIDLDDVRGAMPLDRRPAAARDYAGRGDVLPADRTTSSTRAVLASCHAAMAARPHAGLETGTRMKLRGRPRAMARTAERGHAAGDLARESRETSAGVATIAGLPPPPRSLELETAGIDGAPNRRVRAQRPSGAQIHSVGPFPRLRVAVSRGRNTGARRDPAVPHAPRERSRGMYPSRGAGMRAAFLRCAGFCTRLARMSE